ncbi:MAG: 3-deoxy-manno-octulosonate cytidylyltransferase [Prevotella sp.]|nr:3-deoxy-manno-octulosonate cytidylyltransferase [Bacteroidales bacterium]MDY3356464.1 3-deoxy-manno-octulosonate cytidylyltransferase [Prevotella sp.]MDY4432293.1 3-deoxy-manno-octulosonate cytidylyltransferase [Prevotella sp.]MDY4464192.1 3-deoxy-manno-octulosonate cytidylyltransferase [Prevotella sp.]MDY5876479.1 3-deoxy-manno-octulosonate cytidylyltransferase [Prevotella sp.]
MRFIGIIPARYASTRFPGKPLAMLCGKTVIERVYCQAKKMIDDVYVATDDSRIYETVVSFGGKAVMTSTEHRSGTDRVEEAVTKVSAETGQTWDVVINIQGDEPFIHPQQIKTVMSCFDDHATQIATLGKPFGDDIEAIENPNSPKIAVSISGYAIYFSRSVIPYCRGAEREAWGREFPYLKHIGLYAYRREVLRQITQIRQSPLEKAESLEQLRWLEHGYRIKVGLTDMETIGIDTPHDFERAEEFLSRTERR